MTFLFYDTIKILKTISWICEICACEEYVMSEWLKLSFKVYIYIYIYIYWYLQSGLRYETWVWNKRENHVFNLCTLVWRIKPTFHNLHCFQETELFHLKNLPIANSQLNRGSFESKQNCLILLSLFKLTTCFGLCTGPSSVQRPKHVVSLN